MILQNTGTTEKLFCISAQRTGTTSVGQFFRHFGYDVADWDISNTNTWSYYWEQGDFERIFDSADFKSNQVFEDAPWWLPEFYKVLYHRFPGSKFILFTRNPEAWFESMLKHSGGMVPGNTRRHCKVYHREEEFYNLFGEEELKSYDGNLIDNLLSLKGHEAHYISWYNLRNREIFEFFDSQDKGRLFHSTLEDVNKWQKLGEFLNIDVPDGFEIHANKSV